MMVNLNDITADFNQNYDTHPGLKNGIGRDIWKKI